MIYVFELNTTCRNNRFCITNHSVVPVEFFFGIYSPGLRNLDKNIAGFINMLSNCSFEIDFSFASAYLNGNLKKISNITIYKCRPLKF